MQRTRQHTRQSNTLLQENRREAKAHTYAPLTAGTPDEAPRHDGGRNAAERSVRSGIQSQFMPRYSYKHCKHSTLHSGI